MASLKRLVNSYEEMVHERLQPSCERYGAKVFLKVGLKDVLKIERSGIDDDSYAYALMAHYDFVASENYVPVFAAEFDGPTHDDPEQRRRDAMKDALSERFGLPLLRLREAHLEVYRTHDLVTYLVEQFFLGRGFDEAQQRGDIPPDETFDPALFLAGPGEKPFPLWLSLDAQNEIARMYEQGKLRRRIPWYVIGHDEEGARRGLFWAELPDGSFVYVTTGARSQNFPVNLSDLVSQVGIVKLHARIERVLSGKAAPTTREEMDATIARYRQLKPSRSLTGG